MTTTGAGVQANNIDIESSLSWSSSGTLALDAYQSIAVAQPVSLTGLSGISFRTVDGGSNGMLFFGSGGNVAIQNLASTLVINGQSYALANTLPSLVGAIKANPGGFFALAASYNAGGDGTYTESPISTTLTGTLQGLGNVIADLSIHHLAGKKRESAYIGLVSIIGSTGSIAGLKLTHSRIKSAANKHVGDAVGGLVGMSEGTLFNDSWDGVLLSSDQSVAGLAGVNTGTVTLSSAKGRIKAPYGGGLIGFNAGLVSLSNADVSISASVDAGGLVDINDGGTITQSYANGAVSVGDNTGNDPIAGGLIGGSTGSVSNSYATGSVTGGTSSQIGGFIGYNPDPVETSYSTGQAQGGAGSEVGGFSGINGGFTDCDWDTTTSKNAEGTGCCGNEPGLTGLTTKQLKTGLPQGFDPAIWAQTKGVNKGFPYLSANPPQTKDGRP